VNAFSLIMLAWPLYLAVNKRLHNYIDLAKPTQTGEAAETSDSGGVSSTPSLIDNAILAMTIAAV
jgi:hypothetical protein